MTASPEATPGFNQLIPDKILTPDSVDTSIGTLEFFDGMPTEATLTKVYDNLDLIRGVETFLNGIPAASMEGLRLGFVASGINACHQVAIFAMMDSNSLFLTGNTDTVYAATMLDLKASGPVVVEVPPKCGPGTVDDAFFRFVIDMGAPGPDRGAGGKYLILPPDDAREVTAPIGGAEAVIDGETYFVTRSPSYINLVALRGFLVDRKPDTAIKMFTDGVRIYPLDQAANPPEMQFHNASGSVVNTVHANNFEFFRELHDVIEREPISFLDPELRGIFSSIGIQKGKPFAPDERMTTILTDAVAIGNATARALALRPREKTHHIYPGDASGWFLPIPGGNLSG